MTFSTPDRAPIFPCQLFFLFQHSDAGIVPALVVRDRRGTHNLNVWLARRRKEASAR